MKLFWEKLPTLKYAPDSREGATTSLINNKLFLFGGLNMDLHRDMQILQVSSLRWMKPQEFKVKYAPHARVNHTAVIYNENIIIFGG